MAIKGNRSLDVALLLKRDDFGVGAGLHIDPVYIDQVCVLFVLGFDGDLAGKGKCASGFIDEGLAADSHGFGSAIAHVDIEAHFLNGEVFGLLHEQLPNVLLLGLGEMGLLGLQLARSIAYLDVDYAFHHGFYLTELVLAPYDVLARHLLDQLVVQVFVFGLFGDLGPAERTFLVD